MHYEQEPLFDAYQDNGYGGPPCDYQQLPPYAYEPPLQHSFEPPYSQAPFHHSPPYDPNPYPPYQPPYEPYEPYIEPLQFQHNYPQEPPPQYTPSPYPYQEEPHSYYEPFLPTTEPSYPPQAPIDDTFSVICQGQRELQTTLTSTLTGLTSKLQALISRVDPHNDFSITPPPSMKEHPYPSIQEQYDPYYASNMKQERRDRLRDLMDRIHISILREKQEEAQKVEEQVEKAEIIEDEKVVEDLGDAEPPWETKVIAPPSKTFEFDVEEGVQPPRHIMVEDFKEVDHEMDSIIDDFLSTIESYPIRLEEKVIVEETCQEVEIIKEEPKRVKHTLAGPPLETPLPKPSPSVLSFKWVNLFPLSFNFSLAYGLLETDGQLGAVCGFKSKRGMISGWQHNPRFIMVGCSRSKCNGSRIQEDQLWELKPCEGLHQGLVTLFGIVGAYWKSRHWWKFQDEFKHKPP
ncbi:uncharacterized protein DS421_2g49200 [Arachis hypogaea]|nr:uncharacterized protein DS421_2g49200 [Arachis hypogaea]